ncbi:hypothetical protein SHIRM173S_08476 [Streptomyces hirsutus]
MLLFSLVSATRPVASAVAVRMLDPLVAVQVPSTVTGTLAPAATAPVVPSRVRSPTSSRVTEPAGTAEVPRLCTVTVKETAAPTAGLAGSVAIARTSRSGPGLRATVSLSVAVRLLLVSSCSKTVFVGSTTADTV